MEICLGPKSCSRGCLMHVGFPATKKIVLWVCKLGWLWHTIRISGLTGRLFAPPKTVEYATHPIIKVASDSNLAGRLLAASYDFRAVTSTRRPASSHHKNRSFAAAKLPIIIFLHQTINSRFDMIAPVHQWGTRTAARTIIKAYYVLLQLIRVQEPHVDYLPCLI